MPASVIRTGPGVPGGINNASGDFIDLPLGGNFLQWSPLQLTDYGIEMDGTGTVELIGPSSLVNNSSLILTGPEANLINDGTMRLQHSQVTVDGSLAGYGSVIATQGSTITASSTVPSQIPYISYVNKPDPTVTATSTFPSETITLQSSILDISGGATTFLAPVTMDAASTVNLEGGLSVGAGQKFTVQSAGGPKLGTLNNDGDTNVAGTMTVDANLAQPGNSGNTYIGIDNCGDLILEGSTTGGGIGITSGTLEFAQSPGFLHSPETASENFHAWLAFTGTAGALEFDGITGALSVHYNLTRDDLSVSNHGHVIADFHFAAAQQPYSAAEFSVKGNEVLYHFIRQA